MVHFNKAAGRWKVKNLKLWRGDNIIDNISLEAVELLRSSEKN